MFCGLAMTAGSAVIAAPQALAVDQVVTQQDWDTYCKTPRPNKPARWGAVLNQNSAFGWNCHVGLNHNIAINVHDLCRWKTNRNNVQVVLGNNTTNGWVCRF